MNSHIILQIQIELPWLSILLPRQQLYGSDCRDYCGEKMEIWVRSFYNYIATRKLDTRTATLATRKLLDIVDIIRYF